MDYYQYNLNLLRERHKDLVERLDKVTPSQKIFPHRINIRRNLSKFDIIVVLGFGNGEYIKDILELTDKRSFILVIDHDLASFKKALSLVDLTSILTEDRVCLSIGEDPISATLVKIEEYFGGFKGYWEAIIVFDQDFIKSNPKYYKEIEENIRMAVSFAGMIMNTSLRTSLIWQENIIRNIPAMVRYPGVDRLYDKFQNYPAIVVSPGPSLNKNVLELKKAKGGCLIISVDTALKYLLKHGIEPDLVVAVDGGESNYIHNFKDISIPLNISLIADLQVYPQIILEFQGPIFVSSYGNETIKWLGRFIDFKGFTIKGGGSTSHIAFWIAELLGCNPIVFVGLDLSFPNNRIYAKGVNEKKEIEAKDLLEKEEMIWIEDTFGEKVMTSKNFYNFLCWFEIAIKILQKKNTKFIDATEGGARIKGTEVMSLKEVIDTYCQEKVEIDRILKEAIETYRPPKLSRLIDALDKVGGRLEEVKELSKKGEELIEKNRTRNFMESLNILDSLRNQIINFCDFLYLDHSNIENLLLMFDSELNKISEEEPELSLKVAQAYRDFFSGISKLCQSRIPIIKEVKKELLNQVSVIQTVNHRQ